MQKKKNSVSLPESNAHTPIHLHSLGKQFGPFIPKVSYK